MTDAEEFRRLIPSLKQIHAGVGNTDLHELVNENSSINGHGACGGMSPNINKRMIQIWSTLYRPLDPPVLFFDAAIQPPADLAKFIEKYRFMEDPLTTDEHGYRRTLPVVTSEKKVLVAGDSVTLGLGLPDQDTLSSYLQKTDPSRQYVNLGISGASTKTIFCAMDDAVKNLGGRVDELIYVLCDNDFFADSLGTAALITKHLKEFQLQNKVRRVTIIRSPYIYSLVPIDTGRFENEKLREQVRRLKENAGRENFLYIDIADLAQREARAKRTMYAIFSFFVDHIHLSRFGIAQVAEAWRAIPFRAHE